VNPVVIDTLDQYVEVRKDLGEVGVTVDADGGAQ